MTFGLSTLEYRENIITNPKVGSDTFKGEISFPSLPPQFLSYTWIFGQGPQGAIVGPFSGGTIRDFDTVTNVLALMPLQPDNIVFSMTRRFIPGRVKGTSVFHPTAYPKEQHSHRWVGGFSPGWQCFLGRGGEYLPAVVAKLNETGECITFRAFIGFNHSAYYHGGYRKDPEGNVSKFIYSKVFTPQPMTASQIYPPGAHMQVPFYRWVAIGVDPSDPPEVTFCTNGIAENATVTPASGTKMFVGSFVNIDVETAPGKDLAVLSIDGVDYLNTPSYEPVDTSWVYNPDTQFWEGTTPIPEATATPAPLRKRSILYGPVTRDFCVEARAPFEIINIGVVPQGSPFIVPLETDECWPLKSWAIADPGIATDIVFPEAVGSSTNNLEFTIPVGSTVGDPGEIKIKLNGKYQTLWYTVRYEIGAIPAFGNDWTAVGLVGGTVAKDILVAVDGTVYIATADKIFKTDSTLATFTEMTLTGSIVTAFGGLAEASGGRILAMDKQYLWEMDVDGNGFTRSTLANDYRYWNVGNRVSADPSSNIVFAHGTNNIGSAGLLTMYNLDTRLKLGAWGTDRSGGSGWCYDKVVYADNGNMIPVGGGNNKHVIRVIRSAVSFDYVIETAGFSAHQARAYKQDDGTIVIIGQEDAANIFIQRSTDHGETYSAKQIIANTERPDAAWAIATTFGLFGGQNIYRSADSFTTAPSNKANPEGLVVAFAKLPNKTLLAITSDLVTNLYKSES